MIRLTRCNDPDKAGRYFRVHLSAGDNPLAPAVPSVTLKAAWIGPALGEVKLSVLTPPTASHLVRLGRGLHPTEKRRLAPALHRKRAYYDLTITAPKTVSMLSLLQPNHAVARNVMHAHMEAVEIVARAAGRMIQPQSSAKAPRMEKWLGVMFHHTHSRERDPHLHTHVVLPNLMLNRDGQWRAMQIVIAGPKRLKLELLYGHHLAAKLRRLGFGPEIAMRANALPEIRPLQPAASLFCKADQSVRAAALAAKSERPTKEGAMGGGQRRLRRKQTGVLPVAPEVAEELARQRLVTDRARRPKEKASDDPVRLGEEAARWGRELGAQKLRELTALLDRLDYTNTRQRMAIVREDPPPSTREIVRAAARQMPEGVKVTGPLLLRSAVSLSGGRHTWNDLVAEADRKIRRRKQSLARIRAIFEADSIAIAQARISQANGWTKPVVPGPLVHIGQGVGGQGRGKPTVAAAAPGKAGQAAPQVTGAIPTRNTPQRGR